MKKLQEETDWQKSRHCKGPSVELIPTMSEEEHCRGSKQVRAQYPWSSEQIVLKNRSKSTEDDIVFPHENYVLSSQFQII